MKNEFPSLKSLVVAMWLGNLSLFITISLGLYYSFISQDSGLIIAATISGLFWFGMYYSITVMILGYYIVEYTGKIGNKLLNLYKTYPKKGAALVFVLFLVVSYPLVSKINGPEKSKEIFSYVVLSILGLALYDWWKKK